MMKVATSVVGLGGSYAKPYWVLVGIKALLTSRGSFFGSCNQAPRPRACPRGFAPQHNTGLWTMFIYLFRVSYLYKMWQEEVMYKGKPAWLH